MLQPHGMITALLTPFTSDHQLNEPVIREMTNRLIATGIDGLFCLGTNGEFFSMTSAEKIQLTKIVVDEAAGRVPVYAGSGGNSTKDVIDLSQRLEQAGATALSIITPYFNQLTQSELIAHYTTIADYVHLPIVLYNIPSRTKLNLTAATVATLSAIPNIVGIKDSSGSLDQLIQYRTATNANFSILAGSDALILWNLLAGGNGAISATSNIVPKLVVSIYQSFLAGQLEQAKAAQYQLEKLRTINQKSSIPAVFKQALQIIGIEAGIPRLPVQPVSSEIKEELALLLEQYRSEGVL